MHPGMVPCMPLRYVDPHKKRGRMYRIICETWQEAASGW
jgi:hypothetical protein